MIMETAFFSYIPGLIGDHRHRIYSGLAFYIRVELRSHGARATKGGGRMQE